MDSSQMIGYMIGICVLGVALIILSKPLKVLLKVLLQSGMGILFMMFFNWIAQPLGIFVGINGFTAIFVGILGVPGIVSLYVANYLMG